MTEPQVWAALGILLAFLTATLTIVTRTISVQIGSLRNEMIARFETVNHKVDTLDRDVQAIASKVFRGEGS